MSGLANWAVATRTRPRGDEEAPDPTGGSCSGAGGDDGGMFCCAVLAGRSSARCAASLPVFPHPPLYLRAFDGQTKLQRLGQSVR